MFVGFLYATTITLIIRTALEKSRLESIETVVLTLMLLAFFAQDWVARFRARIQLSTHTQSNPLLYIAKLFLEVSIVYFLLLLALRFVEMYPVLGEAEVTPLAISVWQSLSGETSPDKPLCSAAAAFAACSGLWNFLMIAISLDVNKPEVLNIFSGHLDRRVVALFPVVEEWRKDLAKSLKNVTQKSETAVTAYTQNASPEGLRTLRWSMVKAWVAYAWVWFRTTMRHSRHIILPYLFVYHVIALNLALSAIILVSLHVRRGANLLGILVKPPEWTGVSLWSQIVPPWLVVLTGVFVCVVLLLFCAVVLLGVHLDSSNENNEKSGWERAGCLALIAAIALTYLALPATSLVLVLITQQVLANVFMGHHFVLPLREPAQAKRVSDASEVSEPSAAPALAEATDPGVQ